MTIKIFQRIVSSFFVLIYSNKINSYLLKINLRGNLKKTKISNFSTVFRYHYFKKFDTIIIESIEEF